MKKVLALSLALTLSIPFANASASDHGRWNYVGSDKFKTQSKVIKSGGGDFKFCLVSGPSGYYTLYEEDGIGDVYRLKDEKVGTRKLSKGKCAVFKNVNKYVDYDRGERKTEFYVTKTKNQVQHMSMSNFMTKS